MRRLVEQELKDNEQKSLLVKWLELQLVRDRRCWSC